MLNLLIHPYAKLAWVRTLFTELGEVESANQPVLWPSDESKRKETLRGITKVNYAFKIVHDVSERKNRIRSRRDWSCVGGNRKGGW